MYSIYLPSVSSANRMERTNNTRERSVQTSIEHVGVRLPQYALTLYRRASIYSSIEPFTSHICSLCVGKHNCCETRNKYNYKRTETFSPVSITHVNASERLCVRAKEKETKTIILFKSKKLHSFSVILILYTLLWCNI